jgi:hypothetical protein
MFVNLILHLDSKLFVHLICANRGVLRQVKIIK